MSFIRLTIASPSTERLSEVRDVYAAILNYVSTMPGFLLGWVVGGHGDGEIGRLTVWESEAAANQAATDPHALALHAQVLYAAAGNVWDRSFDAHSPTGAAVALLGSLDPAAAVRSAEHLLARGGSGGC